MEKRCIQCNVSYFDETKRKVGKTCSKVCASALMVQKRKEAGNYKRTQEQNRKMVSSIKKLRDAGFCQISNKARRKMSFLMKKRWQEGIMSKASKEACLTKYGVEHHMKTPEHRLRNSKLHTGKIVSKETRQKMSLISRYQTHRFSRCHGGFRDDLGMYFRSSWEANYARYLNYVGIKWHYEIMTYELPEGCSYTPDFILEDGTIIEIKGWLTEKGKKKLNWFREIYPNVILKVVERSEYREIYQRFADVVPGWEKIQT